MVENFNKTIKEVYNTLKTNQKLFQKEFEEINSIYSSEKCKELEFWNKIYNTNIVSKNLSFLENRIYMFDYVYKNIQEKKYIDTRPLVFVFKDNDKNLKGLNLNYLPIEAKVNFLDVYYRIYKPTFLKDLDMTSKNFYNFYIYKEKDLEILQDVCSKYLRSIGYSIRTWDKSRINKNTTKVVRFQDYFTIYLYEGFKKSIKGQDIKNIYSNYYKNENRKS